MGLGVRLERSVTEAWNTSRCLLLFERLYTNSRASKVLTNFDIQGPAIFLGILAQL